MPFYFVLRTPSGPVRFRVNTEVRDDESVLVREEDMDAGLLLFALVDAMLKRKCPDECETYRIFGACSMCAPAYVRLGQWRALWWGAR